MFPLDASAYALENVVGASAASVVYRARCNSNDATICVKQIDLEKAPYDVQTIQRHTAFWSKSANPHIVKYFGSFTTGSAIWILTEYMGGGSLSELLKFGYVNGIRDEPLIATVLYSVLKALEFLHDNHEIHRDVRASNILVNENGECKIADFGLATSLVRGGVRLAGTMSVYGETCYMAPEVLKSENGYSEKSDVWALGLCAIEMATGKMPYEGMKFMESLVQIIDHEPPRLPENQSWSAQFRDFVGKCLAADPGRRATVKELLEHRFIRGRQDSGYVRQKLMMSMPPLWERFEVLHGKVELPAQVVRRPSVGFDFSLEEEEEDRQEKAPAQLQSPRKNRFTIVRKCREAAPDQNEGTEEKMKRLEGEIARLRSLLKTLEEENTGLHNEVKTIASQLEGLTR